MTAAFGWCQSNRHDLCPGQFTSQVGVTHYCGCEHHQHETED